MRRRDLERHLERHGCSLLREGAKHSVYINPATGAQASVPRHTEVNDYTVRGIYDALGIPRP